MTFTKPLLFSIIISTFSLGACVTQSLPTEHEIALPYTLDDTLSEAPFGGAVSPDIVNYSRAAPYVGIAGRLNGNGVAEAKELGFKLLIDLRRPEEDGVSEEVAAAQELGIAYVNVPLAKDQSAWDQVTEVERLLENQDNYPILLHCGSANRAGAVWALYRHRQGVPALIAIEEGLAVGLKSREAQVRELLGLPAN